MAVSEIVQGAFALAELGFRVLPVVVKYNAAKHKYEKRPALGDGFKGATTNHAVLGSMFRAFDNPYVGMVHDNMTIVDADGEEGVDNLNRALPILPEAALVVRTVSGGIHYYIPGRTQLEGRDVRILPGLDILTGDNKGFVVVPPSPGYEIITGSFEELAEGINSGLGE